MTKPQSLPILFLWHHHQPCYRLPSSECALMPWVRLHAARGYTDMAAVCEDENAQVTFNFSPVLLEQIAEQSEAPIADEFERVSRIPAADLTEDERLFIVEHFFSANRETLINPIPRYAKLLELRGENSDNTEKFSDKDIRDLVVLFHLAWLGFTARKLPEVRELFQKGRGYSSEDLDVVLDVHRRLLRDVIPTYRRLWEADIIELCTSPFAHPILPLLCDSAVASVDLPKVTLPQIPFQYPDDTKGQLAWAREVFKKHFGKTPSGIWPSEGSVSPEALSLISDAGFQWAASDEEILFRSQIKERAPSDAFESFQFHGSARDVSLFFRDKKLADAIGFQYSRNPAEDSVSDFLGNLRHIEKLTRDRPNRCVPVILDGENPWEYFSDGGEAFLHSLYRTLSDEPSLNLSTFSECLRKAKNPAVISKLHSGSWIDSNFRIWIGDPEKNRAWNLLRNMRKRLEAKKALDNKDVRRALYLAEGSDWFWWFGEPFHSPYEPAFDALFRGFLKEAFKAADLETPAILDAPIAAALLPAINLQPSFEMTPVLDGRVTSFYEWVGAVSLDTRKFGATMGQTERILRQLCYGFDEETLHLRVDFSDRDWQNRETPFRLMVELFGEITARFVWSLEKGQDQKPLSVERERKGMKKRLSQTRCALDEIAEISIPLREAGLEPGQECSFAVAVFEDDFLRERIPREGTLRFKILDAKELAVHWMT